MGRSQTEILNVLRGHIMRGSRHSAWELLGELVEAQQREVSHLLKSLKEQDIYIRELEDESAALSRRATGGAK